MVSGLFRCPTHNAFPQCHWNAFCYTGQRLPRACSSSSSSSPLRARRAAPHAFPPSLLAAGSISPFLKPASPEVPPAWPRGWAAPCGGAAGAGQNRLEPVRGSPALSSQKPRRQRLGADSQFDMKAKIKDILINCSVFNLMQIHFCSQDECCLSATCQEATA